MRKSNYDKFPSTPTEGTAIVGWDRIVSKLNELWSDEPVWAIDLYCGTYEEDFIHAFAKTGRRVIDTRQLMLPEEAVRRMTGRFMTHPISPLLLAADCSNNHLGVYIGLLYKKFLVSVQAKWYYRISVSPEIGGGWFDTPKR